MGVTVTRKPTSTPCDHVKHPERLGVLRHDAGEAVAAMVAEEAVSVGVGVKARSGAMAAGRLNRHSPGSSASPRLLLVPGHLSYLILVVLPMDSICTSVGPPEHVAYCLALQRLCSLHDVFLNAIGIASNIVSDAGPPPQATGQR